MLRGTHLVNENVLGNVLTNLKLELGSRARPGNMKIEPEATLYNYFKAQVMQVYQGI